MTKEHEASIRRLVKALQLKIKDAPDTPVRRQSEDFIAAVVAMAQELGKLRDFAQAVSSATIKNNVHEIVAALDPFPE